MTEPRLIPVRVPDGHGGHRIELRPAPPPAARKKRQPDPIKAGSNDSAKRLAAIINRREQLAQELADIHAEIAEVNANAKGQGFDLKIINQILKIRQADPQDLQEAEHLLDTYRTALGLIEEGGRP